MEFTLCRRGRLMQTDLRVRITMSLVRALWGEITQDVRAVLARIDGEASFSIEFYVDGSAIEQFVEPASCIETEVLADFPENFSISHEVIRLDSPSKVPVGDGVLIYLRKEAV